MKIEDYLKNIEVVSKLDFSKEYVFLLLRDYKIEILRYLSANKVIPEELRGKITLFNKKAQELADKTNVLFSPIDGSEIEKNLNEEV